MGYEVEVKYRAADHEGLARRLIALGGVGGEEVAHEDAYLAHPCRDFARTNEALRLRRVGDTNRITYKGPRHEGPTKTREEIEIPFGDGDGPRDQLRRLFSQLGFTPVADVRKVRRTFHLDFQGHAIEVVLDRAEGLGTFAEVEALAGSRADLPAAQAAVLALAAELGLTEVEPRSYLRMQLEARDRGA
jgi:adenylate cyclase class 2